MNRNEWREGMENEAASVKDAVWAKETRLLAGQMNANKLWLDVLLCTAAMTIIPLAFWAYWTAMVNCRFNIHETALGCWGINNLWSIDALSLLLLLHFPFVLGLMRVRRAAVLLAFALIPVVKSLWPAIMPLLDLQPKLENVGLTRLNMLDFVQFSSLTLPQLLISPLLGGLAWSLGRKLNSEAVRG